jgi:shikimate 5-dehydrogenase
MQGQPQHSLLPPDAPREAAAFDLVYVPEDTPFLTDARARGMRTVTGTAMFVAQAAATFERWFGMWPTLPEADTDELWRTLRPLSLSKGQGDVDKEPQGHRT